MSILFIVSVLCAAGEVLCGLLLAILGSSAVYTVFQVIGAITGVISLVLLGLLRTVMWHRDSPQWGRAQTVTVIAHDPYASHNSGGGHVFYPAQQQPLQEPRHLPRWGSPTLPPSPDGTPWHVVRELPPVESGSPYARRAQNRSPTRRAPPPRVLRLDPNRNPYIAQPTHAPPPTQQYALPTSPYRYQPSAVHHHHSHHHNEVVFGSSSPSRRSVDSSSLYPERHEY